MNKNPHTFIGHPIAFVDDYEAVADVINTHPNVKEFIIIGNNVRKVPAEPQALFDKRNAKVFRIRVSGSWNVFIRRLGAVEDTREEGTNYGDLDDLMFISIVSATEIANALNRHRAVNQITCRELLWLDTLDLGEEADEAVGRALDNTPSVLTPIAYKSLTVQQKFDLTYFEFNRFTKPIHCVDSVTSSYSAIPFYTNPNVGNVLKEGYRET